MSKNKACAQGEIFLQELEKPLEVPKVGDMNCPMPASVDLCQSSHPRLRKDES